MQSELINFPRESTLKEVASALNIIAQASDADAKTALSYEAADAANAAAGNAGSKAALANTAADNANTAASSVGDVVIEAREVISDAKEATQDAIDAVDDLAATALRTSASRWDFHKHGNPVTINPAAGGVMEVTADRDCTVWCGGRNLVRNEIAFHKSSNVTAANLPTGFRVIANAASSTSEYVTIRCFDGIPPIGSILTLRVLINRVETSYQMAGFRWLSSSNERITDGGKDVQNSGTYTYTVAAPPVGATGFGLILYVANINSPTNAGGYVDYTDLQLEFGTTTTPYTPFVALNAYPLTANTSNEITAIQGDNHLMADNGAWLSVGFNRASMDVAKVFTVPVSATGAVAQIDHCEEDFALDVTARAIATQEGTGDPSPENVRPIIGKSTVSIWRGGKNLIGYSENPLTKNGIAVTYNANGSITLSGTATARAYAKFSNFAQKRRLLPGTYTLSVGANIPVGCSVLIGHYNAEMIYTGNLIGLSAGQFSKTVTLTKETDFLDGYFDVSAGTSVNITIYPQLELGTTATPYEPYVGHTYLVPVPEPLYGLANFTDNVDIGKGQITRNTRDYTLTGDLNWLWPGTQPVNTDYARIYVAGLAPNTPAVAGICDGFAWFVNPTSGISGEYIGTSPTAGHLFICIATSRIADWSASWSNEQKRVAVRDFIFASGPVKVVIPDNPRTINFTLPIIPTLPGLNTAYSDAGGDTTVTGRMGAPGLLAQINDLRTQILDLTDLVTKSTQTA